MMELDILLVYAISLIAGMTGVLLVGIIYMLFTKKPILHTKNYFSAPLGREQEVRRIADYISTGQSSAIVGIFDEERTEILNVLRDKRQFEFLYGKKANSFIFSYVDISTFKDDVTPKDFWERVLMPLSEMEVIYDLYQKCVENNYKGYYLDKLFGTLGDENHRFILLIDNFDLLQKYKQNIKVDFFATLRSLSSSSTTHSFVIVLTMGITTNQFIQLEMGKGVKGSSLVSHVETHEIVLASIQEDKLLKLLEKQILFTSLDKTILQKIVKLIGGHPYLLKFVKDYLQQHEDNLSSKQDDIVKAIEMELKDKVQFILKSDFVKDGQFTALENVVNSDFQNQIQEELQKELKKLGLLDLINLLLPETKLAHSE
jgi:hypothetical protein